MAMAITKQEAKHAVKRLEGLKTRIASIRKRAEQTTEKFIRTAETGGAAFTMGMIQGRTGGIEVVGVPLELGLGIGLNVLGYFGGAGKHSDHLNNLGDGCLAAYLTMLGRGVGVSMKGKSLSGGSAGALSSKGVSLSPEEIAMAAERVPA